MNESVVVVGSLNRDLRIEVKRRPMPGETVMATTLGWSNGGKGGNQAVAAARAGAQVRMIGAVGDDKDGLAQLAELEAFGIDTSRVRRAIGRPTGGAFIVLTPDGENSILVHAGANTRVDPGGPDQYADADVVVVQTEIGPTIAAEAAAAARAAGARLVVNAAPVVLGDTMLYRQADPLVVNEHEALELLDGTAENDPAELGRQLLSRYGATSVVITLGGRGAVVVDAHGATLVPASTVDRVVDTTGAGDTFVGALAARVASGQKLEDAAAEAAAHAARCVRWPGARPPAPPGGKAAFGSDPGWPPAGPA